MFNDRYTDDEIDIWGSEADDDLADTIGSHADYADAWASSYGLSPERLSAAHRTLKSFVDTFSRPDEQYSVEFGRGGIASTDLTSRKVQISSDPLYDDTLSAAEAGQVLVGLACHEAAHSRYGKNYRDAVRKTFGNAQSPAVLSNLLGDVSDERSFTAEYPGYGGIFNPALRWTGKMAAEQTAHLTDPINTGIHAVRYADHFDWTGNEAELAWWQAWAAEHGQAGSSADLHIKGIQTALEHIAQQQPEQPQGGNGQGEGGKDEGEGQPDGQQGKGSGQPGSGEGKPEQAQGEQPGNGGQPSPQELAKAVDEAAGAAALQAADASSELGARGVSLTGAVQARADRDNDANANRSINDVAHLDGVEVGTIFGFVEHLDARSLKTGRSARSLPSAGSAATAIRNAFMRDRGGHTDITKGEKRGRCDNGSLYRIATGDNRLFHRRSSPSPDQWVVWVLIDWSSSMEGRTEATLAAARALAAASRQTPTMRMAVKTWTTGQRQLNATATSVSALATASVIDVWGTGQSVSALATASVIDVWETGQSIERLADAYRAGMGGTPDWLAMGWAAKHLPRELRGSERGMIVFLSDGDGSPTALKKGVEAARKAGLEVVSMALANGVTQADIYGADRVIPYTGSITEAAGPLARMLTRVMGAGRK